MTAQGLALTSAGVMLGLVVAQLAGGMLRAVLFQTRPSDLVATGAASVLLLTAAAIACLAPARRAARLAPLDGLTCE